MTEEQQIYIPSGSTLLDLALGGGWGLNRISNVVGDKSTGKTLLAIEGMINFGQMFSPNCNLRYGEAEAAFDESYAEQLGFPDSVKKPEDPLNTVEDFHTDLKAFCDLSGPGMYCLDSLDALSDEAEMARPIGKKVKVNADGEVAENPGSYGVDKAKKLSKLFRQLVRPIEASNKHLMVISQVRDNIGVMFGDHYSRSGGKSLDFYASQIVWLSQLGQIKRTIRGCERTIGVNIKANVKKNKCGKPFRQVSFAILFGYGIDDEASMIDWLKFVKAYTETEAKNLLTEVGKARDTGDRSTLNQITSNLKQRCQIEWSMIEEALEPKMKKYDTAALLPKVVIARR